MWEKNNPSFKHIESTYHWLQIFHLDYLFLRINHNGRKTEFQLCQKAGHKLGKTTCPTPWNQGSIPVSEPDKKEPKMKPCPRRVPCLCFSVQQSHVVWNRGHYSVDQGRAILGCIYLCNSAMSSSVSPSCPFHLRVCTCRSKTQSDFSHVDLR